MRKEERIFAALSGIDEDLLERSERRAAHPNRWLAWGAALAACLLVAVGIYELLPKEPELPSYLVDDYPSDYFTEPDKDICASPDPQPDTQPVKLHCQLGLDERQNTPEFTYWMNDEVYLSYVEVNACIIVPRDPPAPAPEQELPECKLVITYKSGRIADILEEFRRALESRYETVQVMDRETADVTSNWPEKARYHIRGSNGTDWDSAQSEVWLIPESRGVFVFISNYFLEAEEGHGARFLDIVNSFQLVEDSEAETQKRMTECASTLYPLGAAALTGDSDRLQSYLVPDAEILVLTGNVSDSLSLSHASITYTEDSEGLPAAADAVLRFRTSTEEPYESLHIHLVYESGAWLATKIDYAE